MRSDELERSSIRFLAWTLIMTEAILHILILIGGGFAVYSG